MGQGGKVWKGENRFGMERIGWEEGGLVGKGEDRLGKGEDRLGRERIGWKGSG